MNRFWNKYSVGIIITLLFVVFIIFFSPNNLIETSKIKARTREMERKQWEYRQSAKADSTFLENLKDDEFLEKYAREQFYMKKEGEEIYLIED